MLSLYVKSQNLINRAKNSLSRQEGQGMVEYAMIIGLVAIGVIVVLTLLGTQVTGIFTRITGSLEGVSGVPE